MEAGLQLLRWRRWRIATRFPPSCSTGLSFAPVRARSPSAPARQFQYFLNMFSHLYMLLVVDFFIQPALQQASLPHHQHLRLHVPGGVDVFLRRVGGRLVPGTLLLLLLLILLLRSCIWGRLLLVMLMPLLLLPLLGHSQFCFFFFKISSVFSTCHCWYCC